jgi:hypothetical protein
LSDDRLPALNEMGRIKNERDAWVETAAQAHRSREFYMDILHQVGDMFGVAARTSDDGSIQEHVLALRVPELVENALEVQAEAVALLKWTRDLDHVSVQDSKDWHAKVDALLARIDGKEPRSPTGLLP